MMDLTEHQIDLLLRSAERLERLPEVNVHEILLSNSFGNMSSLTGSYSRRSFGVMSSFVFASNTRILYASMISL